MRSLRSVLLSLFLGSWLLAGVNSYGSNRALIIDWEMNHPVVLSALMERLERAGFSPLYRQFYPRITRHDLEGSSVLILLSGGAPGAPTPGMNLGEVNPTVEFVRRGGTLVLGVSSGSPLDEVGDNDRYFFNLILNRLGVPIRISDDWIVDEENCFPAPLWRPPWVMPVSGHPVTQGIRAPLPFDRSPSLEIGEGVRALVVSYPSSHPRDEPQSKGSRVLMAEARCSEGKVLVMSRHVLIQGGGNSKEPASPLLPLPQEKELVKLLDGVILWLKKVDYLEAHLGNPFPPMPRPHWQLKEIPFRGAPPRRVTEVSHWKPELQKKHRSACQSHRWIYEEGLRSGWAHMNKDEGELARLASGMISSRMNTFWGVGHPQVLMGYWGSEEEKARLICSWEKLDSFLRFTGIRWLLGVNFPGGPPTRELPSYAIGANGEITTAPSPWDRTIWDGEIIPSLRVAAQWARKHRSMAGVVIDLEMYGRRPLFFGNGVDFGDKPFTAFLKAIGEPRGSSVYGLGRNERFEWLMERGLLGRYYHFLEKRAEEIGKALRNEVRSIQPEWVIGCYMAGILHRWFYSGLLKGLTGEGKPVLLFTFQRDVERDLAQLQAQKIELVHVRGLLMGMMRKEDYEPLFTDSILRQGGYWLNRLTSLVASEGFLPLESAIDMGGEEAWRTIEEANRKATGKKMHKSQASRGATLQDQGRPLTEE